MKISFAKGLTLMLMAGLFFLSSCSKSGSTYGGGSNNNNNNTPPPPANTVKMAGMTFSPATLSVAAGTKVTFLNNDNVTHTVTADDATFDSGNIAAGASYTHTFATAGTINYHCKIHAPMKASVVVQ